MRFPHLAHRSAAADELHSTPQQDRINFDFGNGETSSRPPAFSLFLPGSCPNYRNRCRLTAPREVTALKLPRRYAHFQWFAARCHIWRVPVAQGVFGEFGVGSQSSHVSGLLDAVGRPLAAMGCADWAPSLRRALLLDDAAKFPGSASGTPDRDTAGRRHSRSCSRPPERPGHAIGGGCSCRCVYRRALPAPRRSGRTATPFQSGIPRALENKRVMLKCPIKGQHFPHQPPRSGLHKRRA